MKLVVVDYGMGNLHSVHKAVEKSAHEVDSSIEVVLSSKKEDLDLADRIIFPGQGAMRDCMKSLNESGLRDSLLNAFKNKPFLGICVGAQLLLDHSEEGDTPALGFFKGEVKKFTKTQDNEGNTLKIPHMGWNEVIIKEPHPIFKDIPSVSLFYFVHSYYLVPEDPSLVKAVTYYPDEFCTAMAKDNVVAVQFHPEKSHDNGLKLIRNFIEWKI